MPEAIDKYPEVKTFGPRVPAYGVWAIHVKGLKLINIQFTLDSNDLRPAFVCEDGMDILVSKWKIPSTTGAESIIRLENVQDATIINNEFKGSAEAFVRVEASKDGKVKLEKNNVSRTVKNVQVINSINEAKRGF